VILKTERSRSYQNHSNQKEVADMYHKILVPLDGSKRADRILPHVEGLAKRYQAKVIFLQVVEYKVIPTTEGAYINLTDQELEQAKNQAETHLKGLQGEFREMNIESKTCVIYGPVVEGIISMADKEGVDLIALASHGRGGLARVFYGSVAAGLLHRVDRPLLIIRSRKAE
jgi:nucleotide-binding universal stress UspA family protein